MQFFFNLAGLVNDVDEDGMDLPGISDARTVAAIIAGEFLRDRPSANWTSDELRVEVTDDNRLILFSLIIFGVDAAAAAFLH